MQRLVARASAAPDLLPAFAPVARVAVQLEAGRLRATARIEIAARHRLAVGQVSHALALHGLVGDAAIVVAAAHAPGTAARWSGHACAGRRWVLLGPHTPFDLHLPAGARFTVLQLSTEAFAGACYALGLRQCPTLALGPGLHMLPADGLAATNLAALRRPARWLGAHFGIDWRWGVRVVALATCLDASWPRREAVALALGRQQVLGRAIATLAAQRESPPTVAALARLCGSSQRSLEYAFQATFGLPPSRFAKLARLADAQALLRAQPRDGVGAVARGLQFGHLGKFAAYYARQFGERPSDTLRWPRGPDLRGGEAGGGAAARGLWREALRVGGADA